MATICESVNVDRKSPPQINPFRRFVTDELVRRKTDLLTTIVSPFVKLTSCLESDVQKYKFLSLGFHGFNNDQGLNIFDLSYGQEREYVGYAVSLDTHQYIPIEATKISKGDYGTLLSAGAISSNQAQSLETIAAEQLQDFAIDKTPALGAHPVPGITNVVLERFAMAAGTRAVVQWKCYNRQQLEFLRHHFLTVGTYVVLEWGHQSTSRFNELVTIDFTQSDIENEIAQCYLKGRKYIMGKYVCPNSGNYDVLAGTISNFSVSLDAETNVYTCTTTIVGPGEHLWSLSIYNTSIVPDEDRIQTGTDEITQTPKSNTFYEFFKYGADFDAYLNSNAISNANVTTRLEPSTLEQPKTDEEKAQAERDARDYQFVSWNGLFKEVLPNMLTASSLSSNPSISFITRDINNILEFINKQTEGNTQRLWVGNNPHLKSTNPENMLLITSTMPSVSDYSVIGFFDKSGDGKPDRGDLSQGIWLNAKMIRQAFLQSITLEQALRSILLAMNASVAGYWGLQLQYDDEEGRFTVVDSNYSQMSPQDITPGESKLYRFNVDTQGECLSIDFDSVFPPEVVTQLTIMAKIKAEPDKILPLIRKYPIIASSGHFAFAMNWTDLTDKVQQRILNIQRQETQNETSETQSQSSSTSTTNEPSTPSLPFPPVVVETNTPPPLGSVLPIVGDGESSSGPLPVIGPASVVAQADATAVARRQDRQPVAQSDFRLATAGEMERYNRRAETFEDSLIKESKTLPNVPWGQYDKLAFLKAIITQESGFRPNAVGDAGRSFGLMQIQADTARGVLSPSDVPVDLAHRLQISPEFNIKAGAAYIKSLFSTAIDCTNHDRPIFGFRTAELVNKTLESVAAMYNAGPGQGGIRGTRINRAQENLYLTGRREGQFCLERNGDGSCKTFAILRFGRFRNHNYVQRAMYYYTQYSKIHQDEDLLSPEEYAQQHGIENASYTPTNEPSVASLEDSTPLSSQPAPTTQDEATALEERANDFRNKFGQSILDLIELNPSDMRKRILTHGLELNLQGGKNEGNSSLNTNFIANSFVAPIPTTCKIEIVIRGISGISIYDGFVVDKLPYLYERFGVFHATQLKETINPKEGWRTTLMGTYRFLYFSADAMNLLQYEPPR